MLFAQARVFDLLEMQRITVPEAERLLRAMAGGGPVYSRWAIRLTMIVAIATVVVALDIGLRCGWNASSGAQFLQQGIGWISRVHWTVRPNDFYPFHVYLLNLSGGWL